MNHKFDTLLQNYKQLLTEQPEVGAPAGGAGAPLPPAPAGDAGMGAPPPAAPMGPEAGAPQPPAEEKPELSTVPYAILAQLLLDAFKNPTIRRKDDIKYSDNTARTPQQAYQYLEMIKRNLQPDLQRKTTRDFGKGGKEEDLDSADLINLTNLALKALFYVPKDTQSTEFNDVFTVNKKQVINVTPETAKAIVNNIRRYLTQQ